MTSFEDLQLSLFYFETLYQKTLERPDVYPFVPVEVVNHVRIGGVRSFNIFNYELAEDITSPFYRIPCTRKFWILFKAAFKPKKTQHSYNKNVDIISIFSEDTSIISGNPSLFNHQFEVRFNQAIKKIEMRIHKKFTIDLNRFKFFFREI